MSYRGRFAPSPTGPLHFGSLVAAVASYLDARAHGGAWLVRIEDVDTTRAVPGAADAILRTLETLGLHWDGEVVCQSARTERYAAALGRLRGQGAVYRCRCSRKEVADSALAGIEGPVYPGTCRDLALDASEPGSDRMRVANGVIAFEDRVMGRIEQPIDREVGDFVLRRRDGLFAYQLAVVVDDADQGITDVVRGADLLLSTPRQILLQRMLGLAAPTYLHVPVAANALGQKLSKQTHAAPIDRANAASHLAQALRFLGQPVSEASADCPSLLAQAVDRWDPALVPRSRFVTVNFHVVPGEDPHL